MWGCGGGGGGGVYDDSCHVTDLLIGLRYLISTIHKKKFFFMTFLREIQYIPEIDIFLIYLLM